MAECDFCHVWVYTNLRVCKIMRCVSVPIIVFVTLNQLYEMAWDEKFDCLSLYCMDLAYNIVSTQCFSPLIYWNTKMSCLCELTAYIVHAFFAKVHSVSRGVWFRKFFFSNRLVLNHGNRMGWTQKDVTCLWHGRANCQGLVSWSLPEFVFNYHDDVYCRDMKCTWLSAALQYWVCFMKPAPVL